MLYQCDNNQELPYSIHVTDQFNHNFCKIIDTKKNIMHTGSQTLIVWKSFTETLQQSELRELTKYIGASYHAIAIQFLGYSIEEIEELQESHRGNIDRVKFDILNGWLRKHPEGNPRKVSGHKKYANRRTSASSALYNKCRMFDRDFYFWNGPMDEIAADSASTLGGKNIRIKKKISS